MKVYNKKKLDEFYKKEKLNVAQVTDTFYPQVGGIENVVFNLCNSFNKNNDVNVTCMTFDIKNVKDYEDFPIIRVKSLKIPKKWGLCQPIPQFDFKFKKLLKNLKIDVFHLHTVYGIASYCLKFAKKHNIPVIFHAHSKFNEEIPTCVKSKLISNIVVKRAYKFVNSCDKVIAVSNVTKQNYIENGVVKPEIVIIPNTTNMKICDSLNEVLDFFKQTYNLTKECPILLFVGRLEIKCKNLDFLMNSLRILKDKNFKFKMIFVGSGNDEEKLKNLSKQLNLDKDIIFAGKITNESLIKKFYYFADLLCFPSIVDNCPIVKSEAASQKTPSLTIKDSASQEGIIDNVNGYFCQQDENTFAEKIIDIFKDRKKLKMVSENAYKTLNVGWENVSKQIYEIYKGIIKNV